MSIPDLITKPGSIMTHNATGNGIDDDDDLLSMPPKLLRTGSARDANSELRQRPTTTTLQVDEHTRLLPTGMQRSGYLEDRRSSTPNTPRIRSKRSKSQPNNWLNQSRHGSFITKASRLLHNSDAFFGNYEDYPKSAAVDDRAWYDQFTSTDWVQDSIADAFRVKELRSRRDFNGRLLALYDASQGWIIVAIIGCLIAALAYVVDIVEASVFDYKTGYCSTKWYHSKRTCCHGVMGCDKWMRWSDAFALEGKSALWTDYAFFNGWVVLLAMVACFMTLQTKTTISSALSIATLDENLAVESQRKKLAEDRPPSSDDVQNQAAQIELHPPTVYYPAAGSGVAEVKVILSGFVLHGYMGVQTLVYKSLGLIMSVGSGLSLGKEGPYVHIATCIGNIACRMFPKYNSNDGKRREVLSAAAASGVAVAFGAPISGVLFSLEEVSYYFPPKTLFRTFFCCIVAALSLKFLNPYGTDKIVLFQVRYVTDWRFFEIIVFVALGVIGGTLGACFIKASRFWATTFRRIPTVKKNPMLEVLLVATITGLVSFWNRYAKLPVAELLYELAAPCDSFTKDGTSLCPTADRIPDVIWYLFIALLIKSSLTVITFGIKVPGGIYVPSMVVGGLTGRIVGHAVQLLTIKYPNAWIWGAPFNGTPESFVVPGVYALAAAGATMCGVTRLSVTLSVILFELTGSLEHVLPFSIAVLVSKWTADALEPLSIYDLLTDMNAYPYLDAKTRPIFTTDLGDLTSAPRRSRVIDITQSPLIPATELRKKLDAMHAVGEIDGGLPVIRDGVLIGLIPSPDLEYALDNLGDMDDALCLMNPQAKWMVPHLTVKHKSSNSTLGSDADTPRGDHNGDDEEYDVENPAVQPHLVPTRTPHRFLPQTDPTDFTSYIDPAPVALDICSPMDLVFECFVKLGLRYICVLREGRYAGLVHKKTFVKYVKELEEAQRFGRA